MTREQIFELRHGGIPFYSCSGGGALEVCRCPPPSFNSLNPVEPVQPITEQSFNHLSLNDVLFLQKTKHLDSIVRSDVLARDLSKGRSLIARVKEDGTAKFLSSYKK